MRKQRTVAVSTLRRHIEKWLVDNSMKIGVRIYTPAEWKARGETTESDALLTLAARSADAPLFRVLNLVQPVSLDDMRKAAGLGKILYDAGYWSEQGRVWSWHIYRIDSQHRTRVERAMIKAMAEYPVPLDEKLDAAIKAMEAADNALSILIAHGHTGKIAAENARAIQRGVQTALAAIRRPGP